MQRQAAFDRTHAVGQIAVGLDRDQCAGGGQPVEGGAQVVAHHTANLRSIGNDTIERAILLQPFHRGLGPDLGHARHIVDGIADQGEPVDDALGRHTEARQHPGMVEPLGRRIVAGHGVDQLDMGVDQLSEILVAGGHHSTQALTPGSFGQRADHIVGLDALDHDQRPAHGAHHAMNRLDLRPQVLGHRGAIGLVLGVELVPKRLSRCIEDNSTIPCIACRIAVHPQPP